MGVGTDMSAHTGGFVNVNSPPSEDHESKRSVFYMEALSARGDNGEHVKLGRFDSSVDYVEAQSAPELHVTLRPKSFFFYVGTTAAFVCVFTAIAAKGVVIKHVYDAVGSSKVAEEIVETYNTASGFIMALVEVLFGLHLNKFMPVYSVYLHNLLTFLHHSASRARISQRTHTVVLFLFPVLLMLLIGNSLRGLQAAHSTVGFESIMLADDLKKEQPTLELIRAASSRNRTKAPNSTSLRSLNDIILKNAIREQMTPFVFATKSPCVQTNSSVYERGQRIVPLSAHDLDATSAVFGFMPQEWNSEAIDHELVPNTTFSIRYQDLLRSPKSVTPPPADVFSMQTAFEMLFQGQAMIEKAIGDSMNQNHSCSLSDYMTHLDRNGSASPPRRRRLATNTTTPMPHALNGTGNGTARSLNSSSSDDDSWNDSLDADDSLGEWMVNENGTRICEGAVSSLVDILEYDTPKVQTLENLLHAITHGLNKSLPNTFDLNATEVALETYDISPQIHVQAMRISAVFADDTEYGLTAETYKCFFTEKGCPENTKVNTTAYIYSALSNAFCGSTNCAFLDASTLFTLQREVGMIPYMTNCSHVEYSGDFHGFYPTLCHKNLHSAFVYGIGSYIGGEEYGSHDTVYGTKLPYIMHPRRHVQFSFAKLTWRLEDVAESFDADCDKKSTNGNCKGLWYQLHPSRRYLFAGEDAIPTSKIMRASFHAPISLVQLNSPGIHIAEWDMTVSLERLHPSHFTKTHWDASSNETLTGDDCSMLMDSYLHHIESNSYYLERPLQAMYTSAFYYLMESAGVTELNDTSAIVNGTTDGTSVTKASTRRSDALGNTKLKGDLQRRSIRVQIPRNSFIASFSALVALVLIMALVLVCPTRRVEYFTENTSKAQEYVAVATDATYPSLVYFKSFVFPSSGERVPLKDYAVEALTLVHESRRGHSIQLP